MKPVPRLIERFEPTNYILSIDIDRQARSFNGTVTVSGSLQPNSNMIALHSKGLDIKEVLVDDKPANFEHGDFDILGISAEWLTTGTHVVSVDFSGRITDEMHGMYPCYYRYDGEAKELIATQFESHHAREVFPCVDEPEAKATFDLTLSTETGVTVLGNLHPISSHEDNDRLVTTFSTTPRMSTYLLAWVYGDLHNKTAHTKSNVEVSVWATKAQRPESLDFALDHAVKSIEFFDEYFGVSYPLPKSDHVALPDFSSGAMENWGLITYREAALLADPKTTTVASKQYIATVISHELSHQWFGNLVTMRWWNDLWLNESFATLMEYLAVDAIHPEWNAWLDFASNESILALRRDAIAGVQPVQVDVNHPDEISSLFDGAIVYAKGARLMRMCQAFIGDEAFQKGLQTYFTEFAYANTEAADLWRHLSTASKKDISGFMDTWISQSGYPVLEVTNGKLRQEQFFIGPHNDSSQLWPIPLEASSLRKTPELMETREIAMTLSRDDRFNVGDTAHFLTNYPAEHLLNILRDDGLTELDRLQLLHEQTLLIRGGRARSAELIDLLDLYRAESSEPVWSIMALAIGELKKFVEEDEFSQKCLRDFAGSLARTQYERLGWHIQIGESENDTKLRSIILSLMGYSHNPDVLNTIDQLFAGGIDTMDPEIRSIVLSSVAYRDEDGQLVRDLLAEYARTSSSDIQHDICAGLTSVRLDSSAAYILKQFTDSGIIRAQDMFRWFVYMIRNRHTRTATWQWMKENWGWIERKYGGDKSYSDFPKYAASGLSTSKQRTEYEKFFTPLRSQAALKRTIDLGLIEIDGRLELLQRDGEAVRARLQDL